MVLISVLLSIALMVVSQVVSWGYIIKSQGTTLYRAVCHLSLFYTAWALYNKIIMGRQELGHISFGLLAIATYLERKWFAVAANTLLVANFLAAVVIIFSFSPKSLAEMIKHDDTSLGVAWAFAFDVYIFSSITLWGFVLYRLFHTPGSRYSTLPAAQSQQS
eukprot:scaffold1912_cov167-Amphora_coffeaeformis.AAC.22